MILSNFNLYNPTPHSFYGHDVYVTLKVIYGTQNKRNNFNLIALNHKKDDYSLTYYKNWLSSIDDFKLPRGHKSKRLISRNFWQKLVNKYWQETIFISSSNSILEHYTNKLKTTGLSVYEGADYRNFLLQFSKDLMHRKINLDLNKSTDESLSNLIHSDNIYIQYKWLKLLNPCYLFSQNYRVNVGNNKILNDVDNSLPLFVLVNDHKQIILAESSDQISGRQMLLRLYNQLTQRGLYNKTLYTGLFFVNPEDAIEYQNYINNNYIKSTRNITVKPVVTTLDFYHKVLSKSNNLIEFRLIPDLKEVGNLVYKYQKFKNIQFDSNQNYGYNYFQGQPIYIIKPWSVKTDKKVSNLQYLYSSNNDKNHKLTYNTVFLNYETALNAWQNYKKMKNHYNLPIKPNLYVSNLETFLRTSNYVNSKDKFVFLPSLETFNFIKKYFLNYLTNNHNIIMSLKNQSIHIKSILYRMLWSLTTRQPNTW